MSLLDKFKALKLLKPWRLADGKDNEFADELEDELEDEFEDELYKELDDEWEGLGNGPFGRLISVGVQRPDDKIVESDVRPLR